MIQWNCKVSLLYLRRMILLISLEFAIDYWPKTNQETLSLLFFWVWSSVTSVGIFLVKSTHQIHAELKTGTEHCFYHPLPVTVTKYICSNSYRVCCHTNLPLHTSFLRSKDRESSLNQWPHNRLRETFTHFPIWDSYWDTIPMGDPRGLSKQGSGPVYHLSQQILACFGAILKWQADRRQRCSNILHLKSSLEIHLGNFSGFLITLFHVQRK